MRQVSHPSFRGSKAPATLTSICHQATEFPASETPYPSVARWVVDTRENPRVPVACDGRSPRRPWPGGMETLEMGTRPGWLTQSHGPRRPPRGGFGCIRIPDRLPRQQSHGPPQQRGAEPELRRGRWRLEEAVRHGRLSPGPRIFPPTSGFLRTNPDANRNSRWVSSSPQRRHSGLSGSTDPKDRLPRFATGRSIGFSHRSAKW